LSDNAQEFVLLNNGITIVCDEMREVNRKITIKNPQVVNGCQTCNVLYNTKKKGYDLSRAYVVVKVIASSDSSIVNNIIKGTNRQNIVYDEAFEVTRDFHKYLEEFFITNQIKGFERIYYERRSKQFDGDEFVKPNQKVSFRSLIQSFVSLFLYKVDEGHHHESRLLQDYRDDIFKETQSYQPYYLASFLNLQVDLMFRRHQLDKHFMTYKYHILLVMKELLGGESPNINIRKDIDSYCANLEKELKDYDSLLNVAHKACGKFDEITKEWITSNGESAKYHIKDNPIFTKFMLERIRNSVSVDVNKSSEQILLGKILNFQTDKNGSYYGFIKKEPNNVFFHENDNPGIEISHVGRDVYYDVIEKNGRVYAVNMRFEN
jgi:hypothetical protein